MRSIISLRSNITRRKANITEAHFLTECASKDAPFCYLAATAVVVTAAAIATAQERTAAAIAQNENQNDDPANVATTEAIIVAHKNYLQGFFGAV